MSGTQYYWFIFTSLMALVCFECLSVLGYLPNEIELTGSFLNILLAIVLFLIVSCSAIIVALEHKDRFGWPIAILWFAFQIVPILGAASYLGYWLSRINGIEEKV